MTCETCQHWERQPDDVFQHTLHQKPVGKPHIIRYGVCRKIELHWLVPTEDSIATNEMHASEPADTLTTGINFGCIFHEPRTQP